MKNVIITIFLALFAASHAKAIEETSIWNVMAYKCPHGCSDYTKKFLSEILKTKVIISKNGFQSKFTDECEGESRLVPDTKSERDIIEELNGIKNTKSIIYGDILIDGKFFGAAQYECSTAGRIRIVNMTEEKMIILFEDLSLIILERQKR